MFRAVMRRVPEPAGTAVVVAVFFLLEVVVEVVAEVAGAVQGAELEDGFGAIQAPSGAGDFQSVLDDPASRTLDETAGHGPSGGEEGGVVQVVLLVLEVVRAVVGAGALGGAVAVGAGAAADPGAHVAVLAGEDLGRLVFDPGAGGGVTGVEEAVRGLPQVLVT